MTYRDINYAVVKMILQNVHWLLWAHFLHCVAQNQSLHVLLMLTCG